MTEIKRGAIVGGILLGSLLAVQGANAAVTYQASTNVQFTFNPMLALTLSTDGFVIEGLMPGLSDISNEVTATVATNSAMGYTLTATVGDTTTYTTTSLISGANTIDMISSGTSLTAGTWGYTLDNGTTYGALDRTTSTVLNKTIDPTGTADTGYTGTNATAMKIGAYADTTQANGIYRNVINYAVVANPLPANILFVENLQEFNTMAAAEKTQVLGSMETGVNYPLKDVRDGQVYNVAKLADGNVWTSNLNLGDTANFPLVVAQLNSSNTHLTGANASTTISASDFTSTTAGGWKKPWSTTLTEPIYISVPGMDEYSQSPYGTLYNFCAASAGTVCTSSNTQDATSDLCPAGWRLPTGDSPDEFRAFVSYNYDFLDYITSPTNGGAGFSLAGMSGSGGILNKGITGDYWSSTVYDEDDERMFYLDLYLDHYQGTSPVGDINYGESAYRSDGFSVRCVLINN